MKMQIVKLLVMVPLLGWVAVAQDDSPASRPPASVPADYVATPFGYFHPSCVRGVASGETILEDGRVQHLDSTVDATAPVCSHPHYSPDGLLAGSGGAGQGAKIPGTAPYIEDITTTTNPALRYGLLRATWTVPPAPAKGNDNQVLYFFPGFVDMNSASPIILQPVLQYGNNGMFGGNYWGIASWNCCPADTMTHSAFKEVNAGDSILGIIGCTQKSPNPVQAGL